MEDFCDDVRPIEGMRLAPRASRNDWMVVVEVTLLEKGLFEMKGYEVKYRDGIRRGHQVTGLHQTVYTRGHEPSD